MFVGKLLSWCSGSRTSYHSSFPQLVLGSHLSTQSWRSMSSDFCKRISIWVIAKQFLCPWSNALSWCLGLVRWKREKSCSCQWSRVPRGDQGRICQGCFLLGWDLRRLLFFLLTECFWKHNAASQWDCFIWRGLDGKYNDALGAVIVAQTEFKWRFLQHTLIGVTFFFFFSFNHLKLSLRISWKGGQGTMFM